MVVQLSPYLFSIHKCNGMVFRTRLHREWKFPGVSASIRTITLGVNESGVIKEPLYRYGSERCKTDILTGRRTERGDEGILTGNLCRTGGCHDKDIR